MFWGRSNGCHVLVIWWPAGLGIMSPAAASAALGMQPLRNLERPWHRGPHFRVQNLWPLDGHLGTEPDKDWTVEPPKTLRFWHLRGPGNIGDLQWCSEEKNISLVQQPLSSKRMFAEAKKDARTFKIFYSRGPQMILFNPRGGFRMFRGNWWKLLLVISYLYRELHEAWIERPGFRRQWSPPIDPTPMREVRARWSHSLDPHFQPGAEFFLVITTSLTVCTWQESTHDALKMLLRAKFGKLCVCSKSIQSITKLKFGLRSLFSTKRIAHMRDGDHSIYAIYIIWYIVSVESCIGQDMQRNVVEGLLLAGKLCRKISEKWGRRQSQVFGVSQPCIGLSNMLQQRLPLLCFGIALVSGGLVLKESCRLSPCNVCLPQQFPEANCSNSGYRMVQGGSQFCRAAVRRDGSSRSHPPKRLVMLVEIAECRAGTTCCSSPLCLPHLLCESSSIVLSARIPVMPTTSGYANSLSRNGMTQSFQQLHCQPPIGMLHLRRVEAVWKIRCVMTDPGVVPPNWGFYMGDETKRRRPGSLQFHRCYRWIT